MYKYRYSIAALLLLPSQYTGHHHHSPELAHMAADKVSTLVVTLNHGCGRCFTKIRKTLCKLQETEDIRAISSDEVSGTVTISGGFDPLVLPCKLRRKAGCLIRDIQLVAAELRLTPQRPPAMLLPNPSGLQAALASSPAPACCCGICGCGGYYGSGCCYCGCQACAFVNHPPGYYGYGGLPLGQSQYPKMEATCCDCEEASSPACNIM